MDFNSWFIDHKVSGLNVGGEMTIGEYHELAQEILAANEYQRKRVSTRSGTKVYELLQKDLLDGCVMPPIILAVTENKSREIREIIELCLETKLVSEQQKQDLKIFVESAIQDKELIILDGLQRTFTIQECVIEARQANRLMQFLNQKLRIEIFLGIGKTGILYRMLTLNTGQTPMSFRHQIEILYNDYIDSDDLPDDIRVISETDQSRVRGIGTYRYQEVVDMFYAYSTGSPQPVGKADLIDQLRELDFLQKYDPQQSDRDEMMALLLMYDRLVKKINDTSNKWQYPKDENPLNIDRPFGDTIHAIFNRTQPMTGFGATCNRLMQSKQITSIDQLARIIDRCEFRSTTPDEALGQLLIILADIAAQAKKIGDAQRAYFEYGFRSLLVEQSDTFQDLSVCWLEGQMMYKALY